MEHFFIGVYQQGNGEQVLQCSEDKDCLNPDLVEYKGEFILDHSLKSLVKFLKSISKQNLIDFIEINTNKFYKLIKVS